jgi:predicted Fe-Mo cluster-binding NifX family protein
MKVVISCGGNTLEDFVDPRFGRCQTLLFVDTETLQAEAVPNEAAMMGGGAGIQTAQLVANRGVGAVITGQLGPNASSVLESAGVPVYLGATGTARQALQAFQAGQLQRTQDATVAAHFGMKGAGQRIGMGGGRGMGKGMGMGRGMGRGMGQRMQPFQGAPQDRSTAKDKRDSTVGDLREMKDQLKKQMDEIERRIEELELK